MNESNILLYFFTKEIINNVSSNILLPLSN